MIADTLSYEAYAGLARPRRQTASVGTAALQGSVEEIKQGLVGGQTLFRLDRLLRMLRQAVRLGLLGEHAAFLNRLGALEQLRSRRKPLKPLRVLMRHGGMDRVEGSDGCDQRVLGGFGLGLLAQGMGEFELGHPLDLALNPDKAGKFFRARFRHVRSTP
ncbi:hypothetical protein HOE425_332546 [Hoeflea sp. EC-HK425]|nr:hypothetical protein HOE425_332546 [Hoeflea sp. EC-HK425]